MSSSGSEVASPRLRRTLMRLGCSPESYKCCRTEPFGLSRAPPRPGCFQLTLAVFLAAPVPVQLPSRVHPLVSFASSSEYFLLQTCPLAAATERLPWGYDPLLSDISTWSPLHGRRPTSCLRSAHSVSRALDGLLLLVPCRLISSGYHFQASLYRGFPRHPASLTHRQPVLS
jgi:hypothetical protein